MAQITCFTLPDGKRSESSYDAQVSLRGDVRERHLQIACKKKRSAATRGRCAILIWPWPDQHRCDICDPPMAERRPAKRTGSMVANDLAHIMARARAGPVGQIKNHQSAPSSKDGWYYDFEPQGIFQPPEDLGLKSKRR